MLFACGARHAVGAVHATMERLRGGKDVAWIGLPGIGKSSALSRLLLQFLKHMGEVGLYDIVLLRVGSTLLCFCYDQVTSRVTVYAADCNNLSEAENMCSEIYKMYPESNEDYPLTVDGIPTFVLLPDMLEICWKRSPYPSHSSHLLRRERLIRP